MSRTGGAVALAVLVAGILAVVGGGCGSTEDCCGGCPESEPAVLLTGCSDTDGLANVVVTGPCALTDVSGFQHGSTVPGEIFFQGQSPGVCRIEITFVSGFTSSTDVTFTSQSGGVCGGPQCRCGDYLAPDSTLYNVNHPSDACGAADAGAIDGADGSDE
jgi:hypothetical protein